jgi:hypothetical protein
VFGSYPGDTDRLGDLDLEPDHSSHYELGFPHSRTAQARGRSFDTDVDFPGWPQTEVMLNLKKRSPILHITTDGDGILAVVPTGLLFEDLS